MSEHDQQPAGSEPIESYSKEIQRLKQKVGELSKLKDSADVMPMLSEFREVLDREREQNRWNRLISMGLLIVAGILLLVIPNRVSQSFTRELKAITVMQHQDQASINETMLKGVKSMQETTTGLVKALDRQRALANRSEAAALAIRMERLKQAEQKLVLLGERLDEYAQALSIITTKLNRNPPAPQQTPVSSAASRTLPAEPAATSPGKEPSASADQGGPAAAEPMNEKERQRLEVLLQQVNDALQEKEDLRRELLEDGETFGQPKG